MEDEKIYAVECSSGSYGSYQHWIEGVYLDRLSAEKRKFHIIAIIEVVKNDPAPDEDCLAYTLAVEFNTCRVVEYQI